MKFFLSIACILFFDTASAQTVCFAHRGGGRAFFDNSIGAIHGAVENGFEGIEIDLHQTKDGQIILLHDDNLSEVAEEDQCPLTTPINELSYTEIQTHCRLKNGEPVAKLSDAFNLLRDRQTLIILDLKDLLTEKSIKSILESGIALSRIRLTAFHPQFLEPFKSPNVLTTSQVSAWNAIPRYENFRHPVFSTTEYGKNFHLFSAFTYGQFSLDDLHFGAWEVNYSFFLKMILPLKPEFIVTKAPAECMRLRDGIR